MKGHIRTAFFTFLFTGLGVMLCVASCAPDRFRPNAVVDEELLAWQMPAPELKLFICDRRAYWVSRADTVAGFPDRAQLVRNGKVRIIRGDDMIFPKE